MVREPYFYGSKIAFLHEYRDPAKGYSQILIGTGNSSIHQLSLYQRQGFEMKTVKWHFFTEQYQEPIIENGILCQHLIIFGKKIAS